MKKIEPNQPQFKPLKEMPETLMALLLKMWEKELGGVPPNTGNLIVTYFDTIYTNRPLSDDWYIHELAHFIRQGNGVDESLARTFCIKYCEDKDFRLQEELLAYRQQYQFLRGRLNRPQAFEAAKYLAKELAGEKYGNLISFQSALRDIIKQ